MAEDMLIRKQNLKRLGKTPTELKQILGSSVSYWRDLMEDPKKSFGEKAARKIEQAYPLPRLWLDQSHDEDAPVPQPADQAATQPAMPQTVPSIDWRTLAYTVHSGMPQGETAEIVGAFLVSVDMLFSDIEKRHRRAKITTPQRGG